MRKDLPKEPRICLACGATHFGNFDRHFCCPGCQVLPESVYLAFQAWLTEEGRSNQAINAQLVEHTLLVMFSIHPSYYWKEEGPKVRVDPTTLTYPSVGLCPQDPLPIYPILLPEHLVSDIRSLPLPLQRPVILALGRESQISPPEPHNSADHQPGLRSQPVLTFDSPSPNRGR